MHAMRLPCASNDVRPRNSQVLSKRRLWVLVLALIIACLGVTVHAQDAAGGGAPFVKPFTRPLGITDEQWHELQRYAPRNRVAAPKNSRTLDTTASPVPFVSFPLVPGSVPPGSGDFLLTVNGSQFVEGSTVNWNSAALATTFVSSTRLTATVPAANVASTGTAIVTVSSPAPGGGVSNILRFTVTNPSMLLSFGRSSIDLGVSPNSVVAADFNNDGKLDLVVVTNDVDTNCFQAVPGSISILLGNGDGTFYPASKLPCGTPRASELFATTVGDFNGDGNQDLVVCINFLGLMEFEVFLGNGDGTFTYSTNDGGWDGMGPVITGDFDRDGALDIAMPLDFLGPGVIEIWLSEGNGDFAFKSSVGTGTASSIVTEDFNRDGILDLADSWIGSCDWECYTVYLGNGDGTFAPASSQPTSSGLLTGDFDGDGIPDLIGEGRFVKGNGDGTFTDIGPGPDFLTAGYRFRSPIPGAIADLNGDNKPDVVAIGPSNNILLYLGNGDGTFQPPISIAVGQSPDSVEVGDFNGDGLLDLAIANSGDNTVTILLQLQNVSVPLRSSANPSNFGQAVTLTATLTPQNNGTPTGTVTFTDNGTILGEVSAVGGIASLTTAGLSIGAHSIIASYRGDANFASAISQPLSQTVGLATTWTSLISSANPIAPNQAVTYKATITSQFGGTATGSVAFADGKSTTIVPIVGGSTMLTKTYSATGAHLVTAIYSGDGNNLSSTSAALEEYVKVLPVLSSTVLTTSGSPSFIGQAVTFTASVTSNFGRIPDGETVTFFDGSNAIGAGITVSGIVQFSTTALTAKTHTIKATYAGDATFKSSSDTVKQIVALYSSTTAVTSAPNPSAYGQPIALTATVSSVSPGGPTGTVTFKYGSTNLGIATLSGGIASVTTTKKLPTGTLTITATYSGDAQSDKSVGTTIQTVN